MLGQMKKGYENLLTSKESKFNSINKWYSFGKGSQREKLRYQIKEISQNIKDIEQEIEVIESEMPKLGVMSKLAEKATPSTLKEPDVILQPDDTFSPEGMNTTSALPENLQDAQEAEAEDYDGGPRLGH